MPYTPVAKPETNYTGVGQASLDSGFLLQEDGSYLLQEDGSRIVLNFTGDFSRIFAPETSYTNIDKAA